MLQIVALLNTPRLQVDADPSTKKWLHHTLVSYQKNKIYWGINSFCPGSIYRNTKSYWCEYIPTPLFKTDLKKKSVISFDRSKLMLRNYVVFKWAFSKINMSICTSIECRRVSFLALNQDIKLHICVGFFPTRVVEVKNKRRRCNKLKDDFSLNVLPPHFQQQRLEGQLSSRGSAEPRTFFLVTGKWRIFLSFSFELNKSTEIQTVLPWSRQDGELREGFLAVSTAISMPVLKVMLPRWSICSLNPGVLMLFHLVFLYQAV